MLTRQLRRPLPQTIGDVATGPMRAPPRFQFLPCLFHFQGYRCCLVGFHQSVLLAPRRAPTDISRTAQVKLSSLAANSRCTTTSVGSFVGRSASADPPNA